MIILHKGVDGKTRDKHDGSFLMTQVHSNDAIYITEHIKIRTLI